MAYAKDITNVKSGLSCVFLFQICLDNLKPVV